MLFSTWKSKKSHIIFIYWSCRAIIYTKSSRDWVHFNDRTNYLADDLCLCKWLLSGKKYHCNSNLCYWTDCNFFHLLWKLKSIWYLGIHSINCHLYWNRSHCSFNLEFWSSKFKCIYYDSVHWYNLFGSLYLCLCNG